jgi:hypothetical protein
MISEWEWLLASHQALTEYYGQPNGDIVNMFQGAVKNMGVGCNGKRAILARYRAVLDDGTVSSPLAFGSAINSIRETFEEARQCFIAFMKDLEERLSQARRVAKLLIDAKIAAATALLQNLESEHQDLLNIQKAQGARNERLTISHFDSHTFQSGDQLLKQKLIDHLTSPPSRSIDQIHDSIDKLLNEISAIQDKLDILHAAKSHQVSNSWFFMTDALLRKTRALEAIQMQEKELVEQEKELEKKIDGTDMTVRDMHREILTLTKKVSEEIAKKNECLREIEKEHEEFAQKSRLEIEALEQRLKEKLNRTSA